MTTIQAAVCRAGTTDLTIESLHLEAPRTDEIVVRLVATGVCHTDLKMMDITGPVPRPIVLGHEGAGIVEVIGTGVTKVAVGDPVVMSFDSCGHCPSCVARAPYYCHDMGARNFGGQRTDGTTALSNPSGRIHSHFFGQSSFATKAICRERNVVRVPRDAPLKLLGPLGCGIQTGAGTVMRALKVQAGQSIAVFGTGAVGLSAVMAAKVVGAGPIIAIDVQPARLQLARELGATHAIDANQGAGLAAIKEITTAGVDFAIDTTSLADTMEQAILSLAPRGSCVLLAPANPQQTINLNVRQFMAAGRTLRGVIEGESLPDEFIPLLIDLHRQGRFPFDRLVRFYPFEQINEAIRDATTGAAIKAVVTFAV